VLLYIGIIENILEGSRDRLTDGSTMGSSDRLDGNWPSSRCMFTFQIVVGVPCTVNSYCNQLNFYVLFVAQAATFWTLDSLLITM